MRVAAIEGEAVLGAAHLPGGVRRLELPGVGPDHGRQPRPSLVAGRQIQYALEAHTVGALVVDQALLDSGELRRRVLEPGEGGDLPALEVAHEVVGRLGLRLAPRQDAPPFVVEQLVWPLVIRVLALPESLDLSGHQVVTVDERVIALRRRAVPDQVDGAAVGREPHDPLAARGTRHRRVARIAVRVLGAAVPDDARLGERVGHIEDGRLRLPRRPVVGPGEREAAARGPAERVES